jgi:hypothetical protein
MYIIFKIPPRSNERAPNQASACSLLLSQLPNEGFRVLSFEFLCSCTELQRRVRWHAWSILLEGLKSLSYRYNILLLGNYVVLDFIFLPDFAEPNVTILLTAHGRNDHTGTWEE